jgi:surface carbohydrate biosynthesis protein
MRPRRRLTIPVEILSREFDAKLLLACVAAERGFSVVLGFKWEIRQRMASLPRSIYFGGNITSRNVELCARLRKLGHTITCADEEGIVYLTPERYRRRRVSDTAFETVEELFAWGPENARVWRESPGYRDNPIHLTGHPRTDFLRGELRSFWNEDVERLQARFGRFVLINSNFGKLNSFREGRSEQLNAVRDPTSVDEEERGMSAHRHALLEHFRPIVKDIAQAHPDTTVVVRPHPAESPEMWRRAAEGCTNVEVLHEGHIAPWLLAAAAVIHNGCTTGVESYLLGRTSLAYQPVTSDRFDIWLPNRLSQQIPDHDTLCHAVAEALAGTSQEDRQESRERRELAEQHFASLDGPLASERIVAVFEELDESPATARRPGLGPYLTGRKQVALRRVKRNYKTLVHLGRSAKRAERHEYHRHVFPRTEVKDVRARIARLQRTLGRFADVQVRGYADNIFEIRAPGADDGR